MRISEHLARVDLDALNKLPDDKNKQWLLSFYNEHKNGRFNASLKQIQLDEQSISEALIVIKKGINKFKATELN